MGKLRQLAQEEGEEGEFGIWVPDDPIFDASVVVTLLIACLTVALGSLWSGYVKHHLRLKLQEQSEALPRHRYNTYMREMSEKPPFLTTFLLVFGQKFILGHLEQAYFLPDIMESHRVT